MAVFDIPLSWGELLKRTAKEANEDDCLGLAAQLAYYFFLALFPAILFLLALASFFPLTNFIDEIVRALRPIAPTQILTFLEEQLRRLSNADSGGILTIGILGAIWSSSAAVVAIIGSLNRAYDIDEGRPWWKVRLTAIGLTVALALLILVSFSLIVAGPTVAQHLASSFGFGAVFEWTWRIVQWLLAFFLASTAVGLVYYFAPDAEQDWMWITPGAIAGTLLWVIVSLAFKFYVANFADYNATYGAVGGVIVLLLWFYISGLAILVGAEMNAEIEHASPWGKDPGEKVPGQKKKIGAAAARAYKERFDHRPAQPAASPGYSQPAAAFSPSLATTEIRARIERTRAEMSQTIDVIQERLSPARLMSDAKQSVKDATVGPVKRLAATVTVSANGDRTFDVRRMAYAVRTNPMPFAIAGLAATVVVARALMRSRARSRLSSQRSAAPAAEQPRALPNRFRGDKQQLLISGCAAGLGCWSAWRARNAGRSDTLNPAV